MMNGSEENGFVHGFVSFYDAFWVVLQSFGPHILDCLGWLVACAILCFGTIFIFNFLKDLWYEIF